jgi:hypothetical protein
MCVKQSSLSRSRFLQARRSWPLSVFLFSLLLLSLTPWRINSEPIEPKPTLQGIEMKLLNLIATSEQLTTALQTQAVDLASSQALLERLKAQLADSQSQISSLQEQLTSSQDSAAQSSEAIAKLSGLLESSQISLDKLSKTFEGYKANREQDILDVQGQRNRAEAQANIFKGLAITGGIVAVGVGIAWVVVDVVIPWIKSLLPATP